MRLGLAFLAWCLYAHVAVSYWTTKVLALNPVYPLEHGGLIDHTDTRASSVERGNDEKAAYLDWFIDAGIKRGAIKSVAFKKDNMDILDRYSEMPSDKASSESKPPMKNSHLLDLVAAKLKSESAPNVLPTRIVRTIPFGTLNARHVQFTSVQLRSPLECVGYACLLDVCAGIMSCL